MIKPTSFRLPQYIVDKVSRLMDILKSEKQKYEIASISVKDKQLRDSISWLAQESNQYICELTSQLKSIGAVVAIDAEENNQSSSSAPPVFTETQLSSNVIQFCKDSEKMIISAYRVVLNEPYLVEGLRTLIRQQLNGIMYAFLQLKLLYKLKSEI
ncbi:MAG: hypothetical protein QM768_05820 [Agriterribacter sp.]